MPSCESFPHELDYRINSKIPITRDFLFEKRLTKGWPHNSQKEQWVRNEGGKLGKDRGILARKLH